jgi:hypothetical protein
VTSESAEDARWAAAAEMSTTRGDDGLFPRWFKPVVWIGLVVILVVVFIAGIIMPLYVDGEGTSWSRLAPWTVISTIGSGLAFVGVAWAVKTDRFYSQWNSVRSPLNGRDLKTARRQVAGKQQEVLERVPVLVAIAEQERRVAPVGLLVIFGVMLMTLSLIFQADDAFTVVCNAIIMLLLVVLLAMQWTVARRASHFLAAHQSELTLRP